MNNKVIYKDILFFFNKANINNRRIYSYEIFEKEVFKLQYEIKIKNRISKIKKILNG